MGWAEGLQRRLAGRPRRRRVALDLKPSAPGAGGESIDASVRASGLTLAEVWAENFADLSGTAGRPESVREFLLRTPHLFCPTQAAGTLAYQLRTCVCAQPPPVTIHDAEVHGVLLVTTAYMGHVAATASAIADAGGERPADLADAPAAWMTGVLLEEGHARPWNPVGPHEYSDDGDEVPGFCACGAPEGDWRHREEWRVLFSPPSATESTAPAEDVATPSALVSAILAAVRMGPATEATPEAGAVTSEGGWLAGEPERDRSDAADAARMAVSLAVAMHEGQEQGVKPLPAPAAPGPWHDGVRGYVVILRGLSRDMLTDSDLRRTFEAAQADAAGHARRPGWEGRAEACQVTPVVPGWLAGMPEWCGRGALAAGSLRTAEAER